MAFAYDGRHLPTLGSYEAALRFWQTRRPWTTSDNERPLDLRTKRHVTIRKLSDDSIACRLHNTDVLTFRPDNVLVVKVWSSISTDEFANRINPRGDWYAAFNRGAVVANSGRIYRSYTRQGEPLEFRPKGDGTRELVTPTEVFEFKHVNRTAANALYKVWRFGEFKSWVQMIAQLTEGQTRVPWLHDSEVLICLKSQEDWPSLLQYDRGLVDVTLTITRVRDALWAAHPEVYDVSSQPYLESWTEFNSWRKLSSR